MITIYYFMTRKSLIIIKILFIITFITTIMPVTFADDYWAKSFSGR